MDATTSEFLPGKSKVYGTGLGYACNSSEQDEYDCGMMLSRLYWQLAWGRFRLPYAGYEAEDDIVRSGIFNSVAHRLANDAFTYAIEHSDDSSDIVDFFNFVSERYYQLRNSNYFDSSDRSRVELVLSSQYASGRRR